MDVDQDESEQNVTNQMAVSQYLIKCFQSVIENNSVAKIEIVLKMITKNLTYDDPGMFVKSLICNECDRQIQDTTVMWLINQVIYVSNKSQFYRSMEIITDLQKTIISASFMKQPAFFCKLIENYIEFTNILSNADTKFATHLAIDLFQVQDFSVANIVPNCTYKSIEITRIESLNNLLLINVRLLTHAALELVNFENDLLIKCCRCVINVLKNANFNIKSMCIRYFTKLFRNVIELDSELQPVIVTIMESIEEIETHLKIWIHHKLIKTEDISNYVNVVTEFLECSHIVKLFQIDWLCKASHIGLNMLLTHQKMKVTVYDKIILSTYKFLKSTIVIVNDPVLHSHVCEIIEKTQNDDCIFSKTVELLEFIVSEQLKDSQLIGWHFVDTKLANILKERNVCVRIAFEQLQCFRSIFNTARNIEHSLSIYLQQEMCKNSLASDADLVLALRRVSGRVVRQCDRNLFTNLDAVSTLVLKRFSDVLALDNSLSIDTSTLLLISEIAIGILSLSDCQEIDDYLQLQLLLYALCPFIQFSELLYNHFQQAFETVSVRIKEILETAMQSNSTDTWKTSALQLITGISLEFISTKDKDIFMDFINQIFSNIKDAQYQNQIMELSLSYIIQDSYRLENYETYLKLTMNDAKNHLAVSENLRNFLCLSSGCSYVFKSVKNKLFQYKIVCQNCDLTKPMDQNDSSESTQFSNLLQKTNGKYVQTPNIRFNFNEKCCFLYFRLFSSADTQIRTNMTDCVPSLLNHLNKYCFEKACMNLWLSPMMDDHLEIRLSMSKYVNMILWALYRCERDDQIELNTQVTERFLNQLLQCTKKFLLNGQEPDQSCTLKFILSFATSEQITEASLLYCFRITLYFCICSKSKVSRKAIVCATEMCHRFRITPKNLLVWYKTNLFKLIIPLCISNYMSYDIGLEKSLHAISQLFGYGDAKPEFILEHYDIIVAMIIPWSIRHEKCLGLIEEICDIVQKDLSSTICSSFLSIYTYLYLNESTEMNNKCMNFIIQNTGNSLYHLLKSDIKRTIAEILVYYHLNHEFVMNTFRNLLADNNNDHNPSTHSDFTTKKLAEYITKRFLGVICHFEQILIFDNEKFLKREVLLSLGEIMRFMGSEYITPFRFKLLAVLRTALTINQVELKDICAQVWKIFIYTVDLISLGPLLSTIFVSLEPLLVTHPTEVNEILIYLIIRNGNLLSVAISDLFFLKNTKASDEIKKFVSKYTERATDGFMDKFTASMRYINHDNLTVRIYGLNYLTELFESNRKNLNQLIIGQQQMHMIIENLLEILMVGIKNHDEMLQIATGRCLGKLGAIEPSHLSPNYGPQQSIARSINTDEFAIMALAELCKAYQFQKDTKNVDGYSLAIQEILLAREVCPKMNKNLKVWEAIPDRMIPLMEPLLTSCYTMTQGLFSKINIHPIFGSCKCRTYEEWAMTWASKTIEVIEDEPIKNLLRSFKPSMRYDIRMLAMFLPYIILHAIQSSNEECQKEIAEEIYAVATAVISAPNKFDSEINKKRDCTIRDIEFVASSSESDSLQTDETNDISIKCAKLVFNQLDFIDRWIRSTKPNEQNYAVVKQFMDQFDKKLIASANFACGEYARALMYLESYIEGNRKERLQNELSFLFQIYAELMDPDSLEGALNMKDTEPTLIEQILKNNVQGRLQESAVCFERLMHVNDLTDTNSVDMIQCYLGLDQPETAILLAEGLMKQLYDQNNDALLQSTAEPLWRLGRFDELNVLIENSNFKESADWGIRCGQILLKFRKDNDNEFATEIDRSRLLILKSLRIVGDEQNSYHKGYSNVIKLHLISEIEQARNFLNKLLIENSGNIPNSHSMLKLFKDWDARLHLLQPAARIIEPVLCLRRIVLNEIKNVLKNRFKNGNIFKSIEKEINNYIGESWIKSTELARNAGMHQQADLYILNAETYKPTSLFIEKAKLFWRKGDQSNSFKVLERGIEELAPTNSNKTLSMPERMTHGEAKFLIAYYNAESLNINTDLNIKYFKSALLALPESEKCLVHYAQYLDKTLAAIPPAKTDQHNTKSYDYQQEIMYLYCKSMLYGSKYIYQSMPRVLSIWFDFTANPIPSNSTKRFEDHYQKIATRMNRIAEQFCEQLPPFIFFTAFSQLVSRICHPSAEVYNVLKTIIIKLILAFPQQSLWMILSVYKSSYNSRTRRCQEVFSDKRLHVKNIQKLIQDFNSLAEKLIELTNKELPNKVPKFSINSIYPQLPAILSKPNFSQILLPIERYMQPVLPSVHQRDEPANLFNAFPNRSVYIAGMRDELSVLPSLQRPRRVTLIGSDGNDYIIMMKPKDDLRKDFRLMEFNSVVKQYLHQNSDARQRRLNIRTYAVLPLNEECGILEWVSNLQAFRFIVSDYYKQRNLGASAREVKEGQSIGKDTLEKKRDWFKRILVKHPPIFSDWFRERFTTPHNWYQARNSYIRTTAVMSIVGYILGLGDRHGENILFDSGNGDTVHVDFNCLFNKGEHFEIPEVVPFRLTHNMVHAMGPLGVEGLYRKCCEITLRVLQDQMSTLMSVLRPFVYDPLVSWSRLGKTDGRSERTDSQAMENVRHIEERLKGYVKINGTNTNMPLSIEGVVNHCIIEATDPDKLACMYIGWGCYL